MIWFTDVYLSKQEKLETGLFPFVLPVLKRSVVFKIVKNNVTFSQSVI